MSTHQKIASIIIALIIVALIFQLVRKRYLREEYALIWITCACLMIGVIWLYPLLVFITHLIGAVLPTTTLFLFAIIFIFLLCLKFSVTLSRQKTQIRDLTQKLALLEAHQNKQDLSLPVK
jgi:hypothetical protein